MNKKAKNNKPTDTKQKDYFLLFLFLATILVFIKGMSSDILNFDDNEYFENYPEVLTLSFESIKTYFTSYYVLMYQPLPILSFALTYSFFKLDPTAHHIINLGLHLFNIYLVYLFIGKLTDKPIIKRIVAFLFALHPLVVEAVMWFSCRSSGMYVCFYLLGLLAYLQYRNEAKLKYLILCGIWFVLSLLSKAQAVTFPLALMVIDIFIYKISNSKKLIVNKIPFLLLSLLFGVITLLNKDTANNITYSVANYSLTDYFFLLNYEMLWYFLKVVWPINLAPIYVYPPKIDDLLPALFYIAPVIIATMVYWVYKNIKTRSYAAFGILLFFAILSVSLQILPSRQVIVADRYSYLPNIGLFFIIANLYVEWVEGKIKWLKNFNGKQYLLYFAAAVLMFLSFNQIKIWKSNMTLADRIIEANPETDYIGRAYGIRANYKKDIIKNLPAALADYKKAIELDSTDWIASYQSGLIYKSLNDYSKAIEYFEQAHASDIKNPLPLCDIGVIQMELRNYDLSLKLADSAIKVSPNYAKALNLKAASLLNLGKAIDAEKYFTKAIEAYPNYTEAIKNRGIVRLKNLNNKEGACADFRKAAELGEPGMDQILKDYCN